MGKSHCGSVTDYQCWGNFWVFLGSRLYRVQDRHGAPQPSEAWCRTQRRICLCTQTWKGKRKRMKEWRKSGNLDNTAKKKPSKNGSVEKINGVLESSESWDTCTKYNNGDQIFSKCLEFTGHIWEKHNQRQETLHQSKQVWPLERFSSQRSPWLAATTPYSLQGQTLSRRPLHRPPDSCFNSSNTAWKYETNHQDFASADEETVVIFKENQFKLFWCVLCLVHT